MAYQADSRDLTRPEGLIRRPSSTSALGLALAGVAGVLALILALIAVLQGRALIVIVGSAVATLALAGLLAWRGYTLVARYVAVTVGFALIVFTIANLGSLGLTILLLPLFIAGVGILLSARDALVYGVLSVLAYTAVAFVQTQQALPFAVTIPFETFIARASIASLALLGTTFLVSAGVRRWETAVRSSTRRADGLLATVELGLEATVSHDLEAMLDKMVNLICQQFGYPYAQIFLLDREGRHAELVAAAGEVGRELLQQERRIAVDSMTVVGQVTGGAGPIVAYDSDMDLVRQNNELLPDMRSELTVPLRAGERVLGALDVQGTEVNAFDEEEIDILQGVADQIAGVVEKAEGFAREAGLLDQRGPAALASRELALVTDPNDVLAILRRHVAQDFDRMSLVSVGWDGAGQVLPRTMAVWDRDDLAAYGVNFEDLGLDTQAGLPRVVERAERLGDADKTLKELLTRLHARTFAAFPLKVPAKERIIGYLLMYARELRQFSSEETGIFQGLADQIALVVERGRMLETIDRQRDRLLIVNDLSRAVTGLVDFDEVGQEVAERIGRLLSYKHLSLARLDRRGATVSLHVLSANDDDEPGSRMFPLDGTAIGAVLESGETLFEPNLSVSSYKDHQAWWAEGVYGALVSPLKVGDKLIGTLNLGFSQTATPTAEDVTLLEQLSTQLAVALDNTELMEANRRRQDEGSALLEIAEATGSTLELEDLLRKVSIRTAQACGVDRCTVFLLDENSDLVRPVVSQFADGHEEPELWDRIRSMGGLPVDAAPIFRQVVRDRQPALLDDVAREDLLPSDFVENFGTARLLAVPLVSRDRAIGMMVLDYVRPEGRFNQEQADLALTIAGQVAASVENARLFKQLGDSLEETPPVVETLPVVDFSRSSEELLEMSVREIVRLSGADRARVYLARPNPTQVGDASNAQNLHFLEVSQWLDEAEEEVTLKSGELREPADVPPFGDVPLTTGNVVLNNLADNEQLSEETRHALSLNAVESLAVIPLVAGEAWLGAIVLEKGDVRGFAEDVIRLCRNLADQTALALNAKHLLETTRRTAAREHALRAISLRLREAQDVESVLQVAMEELGRALDVTGGSAELSPVADGDDAGRRA